MDHLQAIEQLARAVISNSDLITKAFKILTLLSEEIFELKKEIKQLKSKIK